MAITRLSQSSIKEGLEKFPSFYGGFSPVFGSMEAIETVTVGSGGASSIEFTSIPSTFAHLQVRGILRSDRAAAGEAVKININSDTSANYAYHWLVGDGSSASAAASSSDTGSVYTGSTGNTATSGIFGAVIVDVLDYASISKYKTLRLLNGNDRNGSGAVAITSGLWMSSSAIASVKIAPIYGSNFVQHSTLALYGIKAP